ncbi:MAG: hypothetical protein ABIQ99_15665 [Thermoflexales bacterium]
MFDKEKTMKQPMFVNASRSTWRRLAIAIALAASASIIASPAKADSPTKTNFTFTFSLFPVPGVCPFTVYVSGHGAGAETDFFDTTGALIRITANQSQQDTFTANGRYLQGMPYATSAEIRFDSAGNRTSFFAQGGVEKIWLPDGSLFVSAGRANLTDSPPVFFILSPDRGHSGDLGAFCAALAP